MRMERLPDSGGEGGEEAPTETHAGGEMLPWAPPEPL